MPGHEYPVPRVTAQKNLLPVGIVPVNSINFRKHSFVVVVFFYFTSLNAQAKAAFSPEDSLRILQETTILSSLIP